jgi:hypothetical protein
MTTRSRKLAAESAPLDPPADAPAADPAPLDPPGAEPAAEPEQSDEAPAAPESDAPTASAAAPLDAPPAHEPPAAPVATALAPAEVLPSSLHSAVDVVDDATGLPPEDPDALFEPLTPLGNIVVSRARLLERVVDPYGRESMRLLVARDMELGVVAASRIVDRVRAQAPAAPDDSDN